MCVFQGQQEGQSDQRAHALHLPQQRYLRVTNSRCTSARKVNRCASKEFLWFDKSAHMVMQEEPGRFLYHLPQLLGVIRHLHHGAGNLRPEVRQVERSKCHSTRNFIASSFPNPPTAYTPRRFMSHAFANP
jgi:hypothetical protein